MPGGKSISKCRKEGFKVSYIDQKKVKFSSKCLKDKQGVLYSGTVSVTVSGRKCQSWSSNSPHNIAKEYADDCNFPERSRKKAKNYCRNPGKNPKVDKPWCFTTDPKKRWEYCAIPKCLDKNVNKKKTILQCRLEGHKVRYIGEFNKKVKFSSKCLNDNKGVTYIGKVSVTVSGRKCQAWAKNYPHKIKRKFTDDCHFPELNRHKAKNYCRNPGNNPKLKKPWCYTTDPKKRWEYCAIPKCFQPPSIINTTTEGKTSLQCRMKGFTVPYIDEKKVKFSTTCSTDKHGVTYIGKVSVTDSGRKCQSWSSNYPHKMKKKYTDDCSFPERSRIKAKNYCRNPGNHPLLQKPWCYTTDPNKRWEYCSIPKCAILPKEKTIQECRRKGHKVKYIDRFNKKKFSKTCLKDKKGVSYIGTVSVTVSGRKCQAWASNTPHRVDRKYADDCHYPEKSRKRARNYCRNPGNNPWLRKPWCYTTDPKKKWEYCAIPKCPQISTEKTLQQCRRKGHRVKYVNNYNRKLFSKTCLKDRKGVSYIGTVSVTVSGRKCQAWASDKPHRIGKKYSDDCHFPERSRKKAKNYCRNPGNNPRLKKPWCYTTDPKKRWEYCAIQICGRKSTQNNTIQECRRKGHKVKYIDRFNKEKFSKTCLKDKKGVSYIGKVSVTVSGRKCQAWASNTPHRVEKKYADDCHYPERSRRKARNYCRNPGNNPSLKKPWCYTTDPKKKWEYCAIPKCPPILTEKTLQQCRRKGHTIKYINRFNRKQFSKTCSKGKKGARYIGTVSVTVSGRKCQAWASNTPHRVERKYSDDCHFPERSRRKARNYCRNPGNNPRLKKPWCYTTDPKKKWEYCAIPKCIRKPKQNSLQQCRRKGHKVKYINRYNRNQFSKTCSKGKKGAKYIGKVSVTVSGRKCQAWASNKPHRVERQYADDCHFPERSRRKARNYCRNPGNNPRLTKPWCYTTDPKKKWEYCAIQKCTQKRKTKSIKECRKAGHTVKYIGSSIKWRNLQFSTKCMKDRRGVTYIGKVSVTVSGRKCQAWASNKPHRVDRKYADDCHYPERCRRKAKNYCRNPGNNPRLRKPWCYTTDPKKKWEYCAIQKCSRKSKKKTIAQCRREGHTVLYLAGPASWRNKHFSLKCMKDSIGVTYVGKISVTISGRRCQPWSRNYPHKIHETFADDCHFPERCKIKAKNYCRNPGNNPTSKGPWCYTMDPKKRWEYCAIPKCYSRRKSKVECRKEGFIDVTYRDGTDETTTCQCNADPRGLSYQGEVSVTKGGRRCQEWSANYPHQPSDNYHHDCHFADRSRIKAKNYCRNPGNDPFTKGPWCYTTDPDRRWEYCAIPKCKEDKKKDSSAMLVNKGSVVYQMFFANSNVNINMKK